jgi:hypothetical protein
LRFNAVSLELPPISSRDSAFFYLGNAEPFGVTLHRRGIVQHTRTDKNGVMRLRRINFFYRFQAAFP